MLLWRWLLEGINNFLNAQTATEQYKHILGKRKSVKNMLIPWSSHHHIKVDYLESSTSEAFVRTDLGNSVLHQMEHKSSYVNYCFPTSKK